MLAGQKWHSSNFEGMYNGIYSTPVQKLCGHICSWKSSRLGSNYEDSEGIIRYIQSWAVEKTQKEHFEQTERR